MQISPEELAKRRLQMRPPEPKPESEAENDGPKAAMHRPKLAMANELTPDQRAKKALGLHPNDPMPDPSDLSPQMQAALSKLDPKFQSQVMGVLGCLQHLQEKTQSLSEKIQQNMGSAIERTQKTSMAQRAIIRRASRGTLGQKDVELARGIISEQGDRGAIDPRKEGLFELIEQREELMGAAKDMHKLLQEQMPPGDDRFGEKGLALSIVDQTIAQQASVASRTVDEAWGGYQQSDMMRVQTIVEGQKATQTDQAATHRSQMGR